MMGAVAQTVSLLLCLLSYAHPEVVVNLHLAVFDVSHNKYFRIGFFV